MVTAKTHFEQVPLEIVKKIIEEQVKRTVIEETQGPRTEEIKFKNKLGARS